MVSTGRTFFITGANSGIGRAMVEALAAHSATVTIATRSEQRTRPVLAEIQKNHPAASLSWLPLDVADLDSVRRAADRFLETGQPLATNHIGPFLLTDLLLPRLRAAPQGRVVNVASAAHKVAKRIDWSVLDRRSEPKRSAFGDYAVTKLMNILHAKELARRLTGSRTLAAETGRYYDKSREARPSRLAEDPSLARELWDRTTAIVGV